MNPHMLRCSFEQVWCAALTSQVSFSFSNFFGSVKLLCYLLTDITDVRELQHRQVWIPTEVVR